MTFVLGVIPARGGSKGVPKKNLYPLRGMPLIKFTFDAARESRLLSDVIVSTDCEEIAAYSRSCEIQVPFMRPPELSSDSALAVPTIKHAVICYEKINNVKVDIVVMLQPTAPLRRGFDIDNGIKLLVNSDATGLISVVNVDNFHPYKMKLIQNGLLVDLIESGLENPSRQSLPPVYIVNGALYITKRNILLEKNSFKGPICLPYEMPLERSVNIDSHVDFVVAEYFIEKLKAYK